MEPRIRTLPPLQAALTARGVPRALAIDETS